MSECGNGYTTILDRSYEDLTSLKISIRKNTNFKNTSIREIIFKTTQDTSGNEIEFTPPSDSQKTSYITETGLTLVGAFSANNIAYQNTAVVTAVYINTDGDEVIAKMECGADSSAEVAFLKEGTTPGTYDGDAVTDFSYFVSLESDTALEIGHTFGAGSTGVLTYGIITGTGSTKAIEANLGGVGALNIRSAVNHTDVRSAIHKIEYVNFDLEVKYGYAQITTDGDTTSYAKVYETDSLYTAASTKWVRDCYRIRKWITNIAPSSTSLTWILCTLTTSNVNGSGNDIWAYIPQGAYFHRPMRYLCPVGRAAWIGQRKYLATTAAKVCCEYYDYEMNAPIMETEIFTNCNNVILPKRIQEGTEVKFLLKQISAPSELTMESIIVEAIIG